jgi:hypothetical protein
VTQEHKLAISPLPVSSLTLLIEYITLMTSVKGDEAAGIKKPDLATFRSKNMDTVQC